MPCVTTRQFVGVLIRRLFIEASEDAERYKGRASSRALPTTEGGENRVAHGPERIKAMSNEFAIRVERVLSRIGRMHPRPWPPQHIVADRHYLVEVPPEVTSFNDEEEDLERLRFERISRRSSRRLLKRSLPNMECELALIDAEEND